MPVSIRNPWRLFFAKRELFFLIQAAPRSLSSGTLETVEVKNDGMVDHVGARCVFGNQLAYALVNRATTEREAAMNNDFGLFLLSSFCCAFWLVGLFRRVRHVLQPIAADCESANETKELKDWLRLGATQLYLRSASVYVYLFWGALVISFLTSSLGGLELGQELFGAQSGALETFDEFRIFFIVFTLQMIQLRSFDLALKETRCGGFYRLNFAAGVLVYAAMASVSITFAMACWLTEFGVMDDLALAQSQDNARDFQNELGALSDAVAKIELNNWRMTTCVLAPSPLLTWCVMN